MIESLLDELPQRGIDKEPRAPIADATDAQASEHWFLAALPVVQRIVSRRRSWLGIAEDESNNRIGRAVCLEVLKDFSAAEHIDLFTKIVATSTDELILRETVFGLGISGSEAAVKPLRELIRRSDISSQLKGYAARSLAAGLKAPVALPDIEAAFSSLEKYDDISVQLFTTAFIAIGDRSSLKILENVGKLPPDAERYISEAMTTLTIDGIDNRDLASTLEKTSGEVSAFFQEQSYLLKGVLRNPRNELLEIIAEDLEKRRLNSGSKIELVNHLRTLDGNGKINKELVARIATSLIVDSHHELRYQALAVCDYLDKKTCKNIYERAIKASDADERTIACAVEFLGYWDCDETIIRERRYDAHQFVREAADLALSQRLKRKMLEYHLDVFQKGTGMKRLASYVCLCDNGDRHTIRRLRQLNEDSAIKAIQAEHVTDKIVERLRRERSNVEREFKKRYKERGVITY